MVSFPNEVLEGLRLHLEEEKKRVTHEMQDLSLQDPFTNTDRARDNTASDTEASEESSHDRFVAMVDQLKDKLADVDAALLRIANGTYGYCTNCANMIDTDRLAILPTATLCLSCEQRRKKGK